MEAMASVQAQRADTAVRKAVRLLASRCPRLARSCYWAGTASIAVEELHHRQSFDLDFHTRKSLQDVRPLLAEIQAAFPGAFRLVVSPDEFGSGFQGVLALPNGDRITLEVLANYEDVPNADLVPAEAAPTLKRVSISRYLADKIQCVAERAEARDLVDIGAVLRHRPALRIKARRWLAQQDAALLVERLQAWTDASIRQDLKAYAGVRPAEAQAVRDLLLKWLRETASARKQA
jgi:hypothetical protein